MVGRRLVAWDDFRLVVIRPVVEADSKPVAACLAAGLAAARLGVVFHGGRPQVGVLQVMLRPVGEKSAIRPRSPGRRSKERALPRRADWSESAKRNFLTKVKKRRKRKLTIGGRLAREYGSLPNYHSSVSLQFAR